MQGQMLMWGGEKLMSSLEVCRLRGGPVDVARIGGEHLGLEPQGNLEC